MTTGLALSSTVYTPGGVKNDSVVPPIVCVPPMPIDVGMVRTSLPLSKTLTMWVLSSAIDTCASPILNDACSSSAPYSPSPSGVP